MMGRQELIDKFMDKVSTWEPVDKDEFIRDLLHWIDENELLIALNIAGVHFEDLKTEWLKGRSTV